MATDVDITNIALSHLGAKANVASIDPPDGSAEANWASRFFQQSVYRMLEREDWSFARTRVALAQVELPASSVWQFAYQKPSDCLKPRRIPTGDATLYEQDSEPYIVEGTKILTNKADAVLIYTAPLLDVSKFPPTFCDALSYELAAYLAGPILKGNDGIRASASLRDIAARMAAQAAASDGDTVELPPNYSPPDSLRARGARSPFASGAQDYAYGNGFTIV